MIFFKSLYLGIPTRPLARLYMHTYVEGPEYRLYFVWTVKVINFFFLLKSVAIIAIPDLLFSYIERVEEWILIKLWIS